LAALCHLALAFGPVGDVLGGAATSAFAGGAWSGAAGISGGAVLASRPSFLRGAMLGFTDEVRHLVCRSPALRLVFRDYWHL